ncbi:MAG: ribosylnicotinamide kinase [Bogoriella megaspora]|nr:MAG: ribosylnicotinamide kinase [Bogoriella megaspora]
MESSKEQKKQFLIGLSGPSSSGKTTLARLLRQILPMANIVHQDDFYFKDSDIPYREVPQRDPDCGAVVRSSHGNVETKSIQDWDCIEAINISAMHDALLHIKETGTLPQLKSIQDQQSVIPGGEVDESVIQELQEQVSSNAAFFKDRLVVLVDGFMLFTSSTEMLMSLFDVKLLLRTTFVEAKRRREARKGYVTIEGYWEDPPFYVDDVVWPNYVKEHAFLFENGNVEGDYDSEVCANLGINSMPRECEGNVAQLVKWAVGEIVNHAQK